MRAMHPDLQQLLDQGLAGGGPVVILTGAGISAESGIPTFRGEEGYWTVGSEHYHPQEMATNEAFQRMPEEVWRWYLYRRSVCRQADPNPAHKSLAVLEEALGERFLLLTQNVDGLHLRAGNSLERTYQIHGNIDYLRCGDEPSSLRPIPIEIGQDWTATSPFTEEARSMLCCCEGGRLSRPHVLWFDECYDEALFRFQSSIQAAASASLLVVIGTSGATNLPMQVGSIVSQRGAPMIVINRDPSPFSAMVEGSAAGWFAQGKAGDHLPPMVEYLVANA